MRVGVLLTEVIPEGGGIYQYSIYLMNMLVNMPQVEEIKAFYLSGQEDLVNEFKKYPKVVPVKFRNGSKIWHFVGKVDDRLATHYWYSANHRLSTRKLYLAMQPGRRFMNRQKIDILHVPKQLSRVYGLKYPVVVTMHDLQPLHFPEFWTPRERVVKDLYYTRSINDADHVIVSYPHVKDDIIKYYKVSSEHVTVCGVPMKHNWMQKCRCLEAATIHSRYSIPDKFMLYPAATWKHKNHKNLLLALALLKKDHPDILLVCTGFKTDYYQEIKEIIKNEQLENNVKFVGLVPDDDLYSLYLNTHLVVIPTFYEAGSGPLTEAMRNEIPVVCSNVTSLPDTIKDAEFIFDPLNVEQMAEKIELGFFDSGFRQRNIRNSQQRIKEMEEYDSEAIFLSTYSEVIKRFRTHGKN